MTRLALLALALLVASPANAVVRRLLVDCTLPGSPPTETVPFDLDRCTLVNGDDITELLKDIGNQWNVIHVRAPSKTVTLNSDTLHWTTAIPGKPIKVFTFLEDESATNRLTIQHVPTNPTGTFPLLFSCVACDSTAGYCPQSAAPRAESLGEWDKPERGRVMWAFGSTATANGFQRIIMGGPNLSITLRGTHPGLGNAGGRRCGGWPVWPTNELNVGLLDFRIHDGTLASLVDIRLNIINPEATSIFFGGAQSLGATTSRITQVNIAGLHWNTDGLDFNGGIKNLWIDPDRTVVSDPYNRNYGWDGVDRGTINGRIVGCYDVTRSTNGRSGAGAQFVDDLQGGLTLEWGYIGFVPRALGTVGTASQPFIVRVKDWGSSGPGTGFTPGVQVKKSSQSIFFKGDPHTAQGHSTPFRFIKFVSLPSDYGQGVHAHSLSPCGGPDSNDNTIRLEANDAVGENALWDVTFVGDWTTQWTRGELMLLVFEPWNTGDRSWGHTLRAASGMVFTDTIRPHDTDTLTGPGTFTNVSIEPVNIYQTSTPIQAKDNKILDTRVTGTVTVAASSGTTTITNVDMRGSIAHNVVNVGSGSTVVMTQICARAGSTITGTGTVTLDGNTVTKPFTFAVDVNACNVSANPIPSAPSGVN